MKINIVCQGLILCRFVAWIVSMKLVKIIYQGQFKIHTQIVNFFFRKTLLAERFFAQRVRGRNEDMK